MKKIDKLFENFYKYDVTWPAWRKLSYLVYYIFISAFALALVGGFLFMWIGYPVGTILGDLNPFAKDGRCLSLTKNNVPVTAMKNSDTTYELTADFKNATPKTLNFPKGGHVNLTDSEKNTDGIMLTTDENGDNWTIMMPESSCTK